MSHSQALITELIQYYFILLYSTPFHICYYGPRDVVFKRNKTFLNEEAVEKYITSSYLGITFSKLF